MVSKKYVRNLSLWFALILMLMIFLSFALVVQQWYLTSLLTITIIVLISITVFKKIESTNHRLSLFFKRVLSDDAAMRFPVQKEGLGFDELNRDLNKITQKIQQLEESRKREESLFRAMIENLNVGVFLLDAEQRLLSGNPVAHKFLNLRTTADSEQLQVRAPYFFRQLPALRESGKVLLEIDNQGETQRWQVQRKLLRQGKENYELYLLHNLQAEMENKESEVIEKLMHTLTHEIMNSISPLTSLSETLQLQLAGHDTENGSVSISLENFQDLQTTARIIKKRGLGLIEFVERYSLLARLPRLKMQPLKGEELMDEIKSTMQADLQKAGIDLIIQIENRNITFRADKQLLLQVMLNLIKNAKEAYGKNGGQIIIRMDKGDGYNYISVTDYAGGVPAEMRKDIFLPFFSTKDKGSGIGLSLSRKIIQAHNGRLFLKSFKGGAEFRVELGD